MPNNLEMFVEMALSEPQKSLFLYRTAEDLEELNQALRGKVAKILRVTNLNELPETPCIALLETTTKDLQESWGLLDQINEFHILMVAVKEADLNEMDEDSQDEILHSFAPI